MWENLRNQEEYVSRLPEIDQDIYNLAVKRQIKQTEVAKIIGVTQGAVSSRLSRMSQRIRFLKELDSFNLIDMDKDLKGIFDPFEIELLRNLAETTCQEETARRLNSLFGLSKKNGLMNQVKVRYRFYNIGEKLKDVKNTRVFQKYTDLFKFIQKNLYMLHEVRHPRYERGYVNVQ